MIDSAEIESRVIELVRRHLRTRQEITLATRFREDLGADSLDLVEMIFDVEQAFAIEVPDGEAVKLRTVADAVDYVAKVLACAVSR